MATVAKHQVATIPNGASLSNGILIGVKAMVAIIVSPGWDAAALSFQASDDDGVTWLDMFDDGGNEITIPAASVVPGRRISFDPPMFASVTFVKVRSGLTGAPVNQTASRALTLVSRHFYGKN